MKQKCYQWSSVSGALKIQGETCLVWCQVLTYYSFVDTEYADKLSPLNEIKLDIYSQNYKSWLQI